MGVAPSQMNPEGSEKKHAPRGHPSVRSEMRIGTHRADEPRNCLQRPPHHRPEDYGRTLPSSDYLEEEMKLSESLSQAEMKQNLSTMVNNSMALVEQSTSRRHASSRAAVHPVVEKYDHSSQSRPIERLPPPAHEKRRDERRGSSSLPVRCPRKSSASNGMSSISDDSEYLAKLYDLRTWNMYRLITDTRRKRQIVYEPSIVEEKSPEIDDAMEEDAERASSFTTNMIFAIDFE